MWNRKSEKPRRARVRRNLLAPEQSADGEPEFKTHLPIDRWNPIVPSEQVGLVRKYYENLKIEDSLLVEDEFKSAREAKLLPAKVLVKAAITGRKRIVNVPSEDNKRKKRSEAKGPKDATEKVKKQRRKDDTAKK